MGCSANCLVAFLCCQPCYAVNVDAICQKKKIDNRKSDTSWTVRKKLHPAKKSHPWSHECAATFESQEQDPHSDHCMTMIMITCMTPCHTTRGCETLGHVSLTVTYGHVKESRRKQDHTHDPLSPPCGTLSWLHDTLLCECDLPSSKHDTSSCKCDTSSCKRDTSSCRHDISSRERDISSHKHDTMSHGV